jgi:hypothetical protein
MFPPFPHVKIDLPLREIAVLAIEGQLSRGAGLPGPMKLIYLKEEQSSGVQRRVTPAGNIVSEQNDATYPGARVLRVH